MTDNGDQLSVTFAAHEHLAPDAADVLARAHRIARSYQRRRWAVRATGGAVLGAGLVASGIALPGRLGHSSGDQTVIATPLAGGGSASPSASPSTTYTQSEELAEYFAAGYDYNDAVQLATLWNDTDIVTVKADAGLKLLEGETLPIPPSESPGAGAETVVGSSKVSAKKERLAKLVKSYAATDDSMSPALTAYFAAGYDYPNAVALGQLWNETDITQIKTEAGQKLLDGETLPVKPDNPPPPADSKGDAARAAFFAAGYTYQDAVTLGNMWNDTNTYQVKAEAGQKLLDGQTLPIAP
jgi:hypothetical protein